MTSFNKQIRGMTISDPFKLEQLELREITTVDEDVVSMHPAGTLLGLATYDLNPTTCLDVLVTVRAMNQQKKSFWQKERTHIFSPAQSSRVSEEGKVPVEKQIKLVIEEEDSKIQWLPPTSEGLVVEEQVDPEPEVDSTYCCCCRSKRRENTSTYRSGIAKRLSFYGY